VPKGQSKTRGEQFSGSAMARLPNISGGEYVIELMNGVGYGLHGEPLSNQEVLAWSNLTGITLDCWTASLITKLSYDFMSQRSSSEAVNSPPPYIPDVDTSEQQRAIVDAKFRQLAKRKRKR
jgi:hypothetical protein